MKVHTAQFVLASDLFEGFAETLNEFSEAEPKFCWGSNNRSLVTVEAILNEMDNKGVEYSPEFEARCGEVGLQTYVDLEN